MTNYDYDRFTLLSVRPAGGWRAATYEGLTGPRIWEDTFEYHDELRAAMRDLAGDGGHLAAAFNELDRCGVGRLFWTSPQPVQVQVRSLTLTYPGDKRGYRMELYLDGALRRTERIFGGISAALSKYPLAEWEVEGLLEGFRMLHDPNRPPCVTWLTDAASGERLDPCDLRRARDDSMLTWPSTN